MDDVTFRADAFQECMDGLILEAQVYESEIEEAARHLDAEGVDAFLQSATRLSTIISGIAANLLNKAHVRLPVRA